VDHWHGRLAPPSGAGIALRVDRHTWSTVLAEVFDFGIRERAGALFVRGYPDRHPELLVGIEWMPVPDEYVLPSAHGLAFDGRFNLRVAERAAELRAGAILVHAHPGVRPPVPSITDAEQGAAFMAFMHRRQPDRASGLLVVADRTVTGIVSTSGGTLEIQRVVSAGIPTEEWNSTPPAARHAESADRQLLAVGSDAQRRLANATIAVIGNSGGGSHVTQQLIHAGAGTLPVVDPDIVEETNLRRLVGATQADIDTTPKPDVAVRIAAAVRPTVNVVPLREAFPSTATIEALRHADIIIGCVDGWDTRDDLNKFALRHRIPYIDIGIMVSGATDERGMRVGGQIAIVAPDGPCLRCMGLVTDERVQASRDHRQGYADQEPDPQVVSLNGTLASEAVTAALMLLAADDRLPRRRRYTYPPGLLTEVTTHRQRACTSCSAADLPSFPEATPTKARVGNAGRSLRRRVADGLLAIVRQVRRSVAGKANTEG
jgi:molybdopterin-synthase adenylyltransferase